MSELSNILRMLKCIARETGVTSPIKILIVDDDSLMLELLKDMLRSNSLVRYDVQTCGSYHAAVELLLHAPEFDLGIVDQNLGDGTGIRLMEECHELGIRLPFLMITGAPDEHGVMQESFEQPLCLGFLSKDTISRGDLDRAIRFTIRNFALQRTLSGPPKDHQQPPRYSLKAWVQMPCVSRFFLSMRPNSQRMELAE